MVGIKYVSIQWSRKREAKAKLAAYVKAGCGGALEAMRIQLDQSQKEFREYSWNIHGIVIELDLLGY